MSLRSPRKVIEDVFVRLLDPSCLDLRGDLLDRLDREGFGFLEVHLASLPRRAGRDLLDAGVEAVGEGVVHLGALRTCDLFAADLLVRLPTTEGVLERLYFQGDAEERRMVLRALPFLDHGPSVLRLMEEAHRTNDEVIFESGNLDSDLAARVLEDPGFARVVLKCAFLDVPKERLLGWERRGSEGLSEMLFDFMAEREAAGRPAWPDTYPVCALAPEALRTRAAIEPDPALRGTLEKLIRGMASVDDRS